MTAEALTRKAAVAGLLVAAVLAVCATTPFGRPPGALQSTGHPSTGTSSAGVSTVPTAPPSSGEAGAAPADGVAARRPGGYYLDDGPGERAPEELQALLALPEPEPAAEPLHPRANRPYRVMGNDYRPMTQREPFVQRGIASWYGRKFHGQPTSIGERYDMYRMTAAHPTLPIPSYVRVTNLENARSVVVRVNDRGPFLHGRAIDLSFLAAHKLGYVQNGSAEVEVELLHPPGPARPPAAAVAPAGGLPEPHFLQLGAFSAQGNAQAASARLRRELGWLQVPIQVEPHGSLYRVRAGPYAQREQAARAGAEVESRTGLRPLLVPGLPD